MGVSNFTNFRKWSLITGRGRLLNGRGRGVQVGLMFYPYAKGDGESFSHAKVGAEKVLG